MAVLVLETRAAWAPFVAAHLDTGLDLTAGPSLRPEPALPIPEVLLFGLETLGSGIELPLTYIQP